MSNCIIDIFEKTARRFSDRIAVSDELISCSFGELKSLAYKIAKELDSEEEMVGIMAHRSVATAALFMGCIYSTKCYVPIDPSLPLEKLEKIIHSSGIKTIVSCEAVDKTYVESSGVKYQYLDFESLRKQEVIEFCIPERNEQELLYIVYTSGSTGVPKGVAKSYSAMKNFMEAYEAEFSFDENTIMGNQTPFYFDASAKDFYMMIASGARLEIIPTRLFSFPVRLIEYMNDRKINFISWVPSALTIVTTLNTFVEVIPQYLKKVFFVGEVFAAKHLNKWMEALPNAEFVNLYGSSEICGISCFYRITEKIEGAASIPIGKALSNCDVKLVADGKLVTKIEEAGEIYVSSKALAEGYFADSEKTRNSFVDIDLGEGLKRYYRTGDIAKYDQNGDIVFQARKDYQIKHMGHRIELGEIETAAVGMDGLEKCCCVYDEKRSKIILYTQLERGCELTAKEIRKNLKNLLSEYMIPHKVVIMEQLPMNQNGKIDRVSLRDMNENKGEK